MRIAFIADVHGNLEALSAVRKSLSSQNPDRIIFLGDMVGYGASPNECIELIRSIAHDAIAGNHDRAAAGVYSPEGFNPNARAAIEWTRSQLTQPHKEYLASLPLKGRIADALYVHGTPLYPELWEYIFTVFDAYEVFNEFSEQLCFVAHSHYPIAFIRERETGSVESQSPLAIDLKHGYRYIINSGSVGQPRDGDPRASYGIYDVTQKQYQLIRVQYPLTFAQQKIIEAGLSPMLAHRLGVGR